MFRSNCAALSAVMPALVAGIHVLRACGTRKTWMAGTSPAMTPDVWFDMSETCASDCNQTLNCAVLIQSQNLAPGGFCRSAENIVSKLPSVTKSYLLLCVVKPCTKVWSAM